MPLAVQYVSAKKWSSYHGSFSQPSASHWEWKRFNLCKSSNNANEHWADGGHFLWRTLFNMDSGLGNTHVMVVLSISPSLWARSTAKFNAGACDSRQTLEDVVQKDLRVGPIRPNFRCTCSKWPLARSVIIIRKVSQGWLLGLGMWVIRAATEWDLRLGRTYQADYICFCLGLCWCWSSGVCS